jgi:hypothetical protein
MSQKTSMESSDFVLFHGMLYGVLLFFFNWNKCYSYIFVWRTLVIPEKLHLFLFFLFDEKLEPLTD